MGIRVLPAGRSWLYMPKARQGSPLVIFVIAGLAVVAIFLRISNMMTVSANSGDIALAESTYPNIVGTRIDTCVLCHTNSIPNLNPFGAAYKAGGRGLASSLHAIENVDSDADGWTNIQEINALTFPGNAADHPSHYQDQPGLDFLKIVPPVWDETRVLDGAVACFEPVSR